LQNQLYFIDITALIEEIIVSLSALFIRKCVLCAHLTYIWGRPAVLSKANSLYYHIKAIGCCWVST